MEIRMKTPVQFFYGLIDMSVVDNFYIGLDEVNTLLR